MFLTLLLVTFLVAAGVSLAVMVAFDRPIGAILQRIITDPVHQAWQRYMKFAILVVGVSSGVRIWELEKYVAGGRGPRVPEAAEYVPPALTSERWVLELYRTNIETLQGVAWMLLVFFVFALIAYVIVRVFESRSAQDSEARETE